MKRKEFLRALLFLTLLPTIMFWPLVAILLGPDFVVPLYAALPWLGISLVFTGLLVVRLVQSLVHQTKLVKPNWKGNIGKCPICDESFQGVEGGEVGRARLRHFESLHPEARKWNERWRILLILTWAILGLYMFILTVIAFHSFPTGYYQPLLVGLSSVPLIIVTGFVMQRLTTKKLEQFRKEWLNRTSLERAGST